MGYHQDVHRSFLILLIFLAASADSIHAATKMEAEIYPLGLIDFDLAEKIAGAIVSEDGKLVAQKAQNRLILYDYPEKHDALRKALAKLQGPIQHVRIQVAFKGVNDAQFDGASVDGRARVGSVVVRTPGAPADDSVRVNAQQTHISGTSLIQQELLVISGGKAHLHIGSEVPYADWLWSYGLRLGVWGGEVRWKNVGAQMAVEPWVMGNNVRVRLTPEFSYVLDRETLTTAIEKLTTEVVVQNGQEIELGGLPASDREFYSRFLVGYNHRGEKQSLRITLKPTIETLQTFGPGDGGADNRNVGRFRSR
ncbi:MAG: hypothetical protein HY360_03660 [Verrucomicrobia bacterium]|nr:hypothetical protein [Verrucomicrobiota bacterium]